MALWFPKIYILPFPQSKKVYYPTHIVIPGGDLAKVQPLLRTRPTWIIDLPQSIPIIPLKMNNSLEEGECAGHLTTLLLQRKIMRNVVGVGSVDGESEEEGEEY
ncbi:hypothetical protein HPG69_001564 [Diceros bicornis minor]|uniref:Uncharacterized protein n=1 Tax=Diceros bicornis minor TaxID=77932 RepID=A0A7J7FFS9_DICBM|nr:hypothetical protein HPG69_001564 [Diceros bicornis minor]